MPPRYGQTGSYDARRAAGQETAGPLDWRTSLSWPGVGCSRSQGRGCPTGPNGRLGACCQQLVRRKRRVRDAGRLRPLAPGSGIATCARSRRAAGSPSHPQAMSGRWQAGPPGDLGASGRMPRSNPGFRRTSGAQCHCLPESGRPPMSSRPTSGQSRHGDAGDRHRARDGRVASVARRPTVAVRLAGR
jgi:hypothetical protein